MHETYAARERDVFVRGVRYRLTEEGNGTPVVLLHGFTESSRTWRHIVPALAPSWRTVRPDLLGHGQSEKPTVSTRYALLEAARDVHALADALEVGRFHLIGYSMGGRLAQHVAMLQPERLLSLTLISSSPGIASPEEREARRAADNRLAHTIETEGIPAFVKYWEALPLFASERKLPQAIRIALRNSRLANDAAGLANSLRGAGAGTHRYLLPHLTRLTVPTLLLTGALDVKYTELARTMAAQWPSAAVATLPGAGHGVHREQPQAVARHIGQFLHGRTTCI